MLLKKITIDNFRSIEHLEIDIIDIAGCKMHTFFGINETGKSNILKAIALLNPEAKVKYEFDCNKYALKSDFPITIKFTFETTIEERSYIENNLTDNQIKESSKDVTAMFKETPRESLIEKVIRFNGKSTREEYYKVTISNFTDWLDNNRIESPKKYTFCYIISTGQIEDVNIKQYINDEFKFKFDSMVPEVIFWEPSDKYMITKTINMEQFGQNPDISIPLKHIFYLAGYQKDKITTNVERIRNSGDIRAEFEEQLSEAITSHISTIWPEHRINIRVRLENNNFCEIYVEDKDNKLQRFNMQQRSDGFKQFISILLSLSVQNATNQLTNKLILLDEPERSLHPGSIKCLRDELLSISRNNIVLASSHSIFMVDKKNLERHYTVTKEQSKTLIEQVNPEVPIQDEIIYNSLGTSIFELIEPNMLIFEGRMDKDIFDAFTLKFREEIKPSSIQTISATGSDQIPKYTKFFHNIHVKGFVVVDSDDDGRNVVKEINKNDHEFKTSAFELNNLVPLEKKKATLEDILPEELVLSCASNLYGIAFDSPNENSILDHIKSIKVREKIHTDGRLKELKKIVVDKVIDDINNNDKDALRNEYALYYEFINSLHSKIKAVN